jgi:hypothetical protein
VEKLTHNKETSGKLDKLKIVANQRSRTFTLRPELSVEGWFGWQAVKACLRALDEFWLN